MEEILELEKKIAIDIPDELKKLLINRLSTIIPGKNKFVRVVNDTFSQEMSLEKVLSPSEILTAWEFMKDEDEFSSSQLLAFGETLGSPVVAIGIGKENYGEIYVFDYDFGATKIANSLYEFIKSLQ